MQARWNGQVLAESDDTVVVERNHYFPLESLNREFFIESDTQSKCGWKGTAHYFTIVVDDQQNADAAFYYPTPKKLARKIDGRVAFWRGVEVTDGD